MKTILLLISIEICGLLRSGAVAQAGPPSGPADNVPVLVLKPNQPNPFWEQTTISFRLNKPEEVTVTLYNVLGARIATLLKENLATGEHSYLFKKPSELPDGMYIYTVETPGFSRSQRMIIRR